MRTHWRLCKAASRTQIFTRLIDRESAFGWQQWGIQKPRGLAQHGCPPGWLEERDPAGVFDGRAVPPAFSVPYRLSCRSVISIILNNNLCSNLEQSMGDRNQEGIGLSYRACICKHFKEPRNRFSAWRAGTKSRAARLHRLGSINVYKYGSGRRLAE